MKLHRYFFVCKNKKWRRNYKKNHKPIFVMFLQISCQMVKLLRVFGIKIEDFCTKPNVNNSSIK